MSRLTFSEVTEDWGGRPVYIIGGGPSLDGFPLERLGGLGLIVGVNQSAFRVSCAEVLFSLDQHFTRMRRDDIQAFVNSGGKAFLAMPSNEDGHAPIDGAVYLNRRRNHGFSSDPRDIFGVNSGYGAINLAFLAGAKDIALLGFDMGHPPGKTHWHGGYPWHVENRHKFYDRWSNGFDLAARQLASVGAAVTNFVGPDGSKIDAFPKRPLEDLL